MKEDNLNHSQKKFVNQDLHQLLQQGRMLHDRAVFELFSGLVEKGRQLFKKDVSLPLNEYKVNYQDQRGGSQ